MKLENQAMFKRLPIWISAPLIISLPVLVVGVWLSSMWNSRSREAVRELADETINNVHTLAENEVVGLLSEPVRVCEVNSHLIRTGKLPTNDLEAWRDTLLREATTFHALSAISWGSADGRTAWISRYEDGEYYWAHKADGANKTIEEWRIDSQNNLTSDAHSFDFELSARPWYATPVESGTATWSEPFVWVGGGDDAKPMLGISYGIPIFGDDRSLIGVIDADFSLNDLSGFLSSIRVGTNGKAALATVDGRLLATSSDRPIVGNNGERLPIADYSDPMIAAVANYLDSENSLLARTAEAEIGNEKHLLRITPIGEEVGLDWILITVVPESDFVADIEVGFQRSWLASLAAIAVAVVIGLGAARWLVTPLMALVDSVRKIGQGDLETQVELDHSPEYRKLANEINNMTTDLKDRIRMRDSLELAMEVQKNLLPADAPKIAGLDMAGHSTYCDETGGDYYDFLDVSGSADETAVIAVGDVVGHGIAAAMLMATARGILRSRCAVPGSLGDFLDHLNAMLVEDTRGERFMTMLLLTITKSRQELRWASAGHGPPVIYDRASDTFLDIDGGGLPLGLIAEEEYEEYAQVGIGKGHLIVAATDGLWETMNQSGEAYGMERLHELLRENVEQSAETISNLIGKSLAEFRGANAQDDDLTFVIVKVE